MTQEFIDNYLYLIIFGILFAIGIFIEVSERHKDKAQAAKDAEAFARKYPYIIKNAKKI